MTGEHIDVYRLEHVGCTRRPFYEDPRTLAHYPGHGPMSGSSCLGPWFGGRGSGPREIDPWEQCGVTLEQLPHWWGESPESIAERTPEWAAAGWHFVHYSVPIEECHEDSGQIVFSARREYLVGLIEWADVPLPTEVGAYGERTWAWHQERLGLVRRGKDMLIAHALKPAIERQPYVANNPDFWVSVQ